MIALHNKRFVALAAVIAGAVLLVFAIARSATKGEHVIKITAERYNYEPDHIVLEKGEPVVLELVSADRIHGFNVPGLHIRADMMPGESVRVRVVPDRSGTYQFLCDAFCGSGHGDMSGVITVIE
jgi:cytochrome c oxidase subunit 2